MTAEEVNAKLWKVVAAAGYGDDLRKLARDSKVSIDAMKLWRDDRMPRIDGLASVLDVCGWRLSKFFASIEEAHSSEPTELDKLVEEFTAIAVQNPEGAAMIIRLVHQMAGRSTGDPEPADKLPQRSRV